MKDEYKILIGAIIVIRLLDHLPDAGTAELEQPEA